MAWNGDISHAIGLVFALSFAAIATNGKIMIDKIFSHCYYERSWLLNSYMRAIFAKNACGIAEGLPLRSFFVLSERRGDEQKKECMD